MGNSKTAPPPAPAAQLFLVKGADGRRVGLLGPHELAEWRLRILRNARPGQPAEVFSIVAVDPSAFAQGGSMSKAEANTAEGAAVENWPAAA